MGRRADPGSGELAAEGEGVPRVSGRPSEGDAKGGPPRRTGTPHGWAISCAAQRGLLQTRGGKGRVRPRASLLAGLLLFPATGSALQARRVESSFLVLPLPARASSFAEEVQEPLQRWGPTCMGFRGAPGPAAWTRTRFGKKWA